MSLVQAVPEHHAWPECPHAAEPVTKPHATEHSIAWSSKPDATGFRRNRWECGGCSWSRPALPEEADSYFDRDFRRLARTFPTRTHSHQKGQVAP